MKLTDPTRNEARGILLSLAKKNHKSVSLRELCYYSILCYQNKHELSFITFTFINALIDMFPDMDVSDENSVDEGRANSIALAMETEYSLLIIDAKKGRRKGSPGRRTCVTANVVKSPMRWQTGRPLQTENRG